MSMIMTQMHDVEVLRPFVEDLAVRHVGYGVRPERYPLVREALLVAFRRLLDTRLPAEAKAAWTEAYSRVAAIMIEIAYGDDAATRADQSIPKLPGRQCRQVAPTPSPNCCFPSGNSP